MQVVAHNLAAQFSSRQLKITAGNKAKKAEKLSSGYRINRSADDAAGLAISEKMRWQIRGLDKAADNCQTAVSFCQVSDGAMEEISSMLQRMRELSVQAANDTNTWSERQAIQDEITELTNEVGRITDSTEFNTLEVFGWERAITTYEPDGVGGMVISGTTETVVVTGNNYGLAEVLGSDNIYSGKKLDSPIKFSGTGWESTGELKYGYSTTFQNVMDYLNERLASPLAEGLLLSTTGSTGTSHYVDTTNGYRICITRDASIKTLDGKYPPTKIVLEKGSLAVPGDLDSFHVEKTEKTFRLSDYNYPYTEGASGYNNNKAYGSAWIDFSGLGTDFVISDLYGQGFNTTCATCSAYYSIRFTGDTCATTKNGVNYTYVASNMAPCLEINISNCASGDDIVASIIGAVSSCKEFNDHYTQYAYNQSEPAKIYMYDNRNSKVGGGSSTFEPASRDEKGQLVIKDTIVTNPTTGKQKIYSNKDMWIQGGARGESGFFIERALVNIDFLGIGGISVLDHEAASAAITSCDLAIGVLDIERAKIGAQQNRLEYTVAINNNTFENTQAAESRIRDTDMAEDIVELSKHNILEQVGQSMLAQANQSQQGILQLLQ